MAPDCAGKTVDVADDDWVALASSQEGPLASYHMSMQRIWDGGAADELLEQAYVSIVPISAGWTYDYESHGPSALRLFQLEQYGRLQDGDEYFWSVFAASAFQFDPDEDGDPDVEIPLEARVYGDLSLQSGIVLYMEALREVRDAYAAQGRASVEQSRLTGVVLVHEIGHAFGFPHAKGPAPRLMVQGGHGAFLAPGMRADGEFLADMRRALRPSPRPSDCEALCVAIIQATERSCDCTE